MLLTHESWLGMLAGWWVDLGWTAPPADASFHVAMGHGCGDHTTAGAAPEPSCCDTPATPAKTGSHGGSFWPMVLSWMTGLMLVGAIPPGLLLTRCAEFARTSRRRWISTHIAGNAVMVAGMVWIGHAAGPILAEWSGSAVLGGHLGMLLGMLLGMEAGMFAGEAALGLEPWREMSWRFGAGRNEVEKAVG